MMSPSSPISDNNGSSSGGGGGAIRHRNPHSHQPSTALNIDTSPHRDGSGNNTNNGNNSSGKLHNRYHRAHRRIISSSLFNNKIFMVLAGALVVLFVCTVGLWSQSSSSSSTTYDKKPAAKKSYSHKRNNNNNKYNRKEDIPAVENYNHDKYMQHRMKQQQHEDYGDDNDEDNKEEERIILPPKQQQQQQLNNNEYQHQQRHFGVNQEAAAAAEDDDGDDDEEDDDEEDEEKVENNIMQYKRDEDNQEQHGRQKQQPQRREELRYQLRKKHNDRNRFHELPTKQKKKDNDRKEKKKVEDEEYYDNMTSSSIPGGSKPRSIYVQIDPNNDNEIMRLAKEEGEEDHRRWKLFHITKVRRISMSKVPYDIDDDMSSSDQRSVSPYPDDDHYFRNIKKIQGHGNSRKYKHQMRDSQDENCQFKYDWQVGAFPNCNVVHEYELGQLSRMLGRMARRRLRLREGDGNDLVKYLSHGYWRDVWVISHRNAETVKGDDADEELTVLKTLRYEHDFSDRNYDRHRKDALASERLSSSPYVVDIFAFCQNTAVFEFGEGGDIDGKLWPYDEDENAHLIAELTSWEKLDMAYQVACGIADIHDVEEDGIASIAHTDITPSQFIYIDGRWKVNDFNRCRFMREYTEDKSVCGFEVGTNPGKFRAPEEYAYEIETEKIDVYSMGNVFYAILSGLMPFEGMKQKKASQYVMDGKRPEIPDEVKESDDIAIQAILAATKACWTHDPKERPPAKKIRDELKSVMERIKTEKNTTTTKA